jgi:two-component system, OmpR family, alkaline phosphatase synthesis response regulator PhoP
MVVGRPGGDHRFAAALDRRRPLSPLGDAPTWLIAPAGEPPHDVVAALDELPVTRLRASLADLPATRPLAIVVVASDTNNEFHLTACRRLEQDARLVGVPVIVAVSSARLALAEEVHAGHELIVRPVRAAELSARLERARRVVGSPPRDPAIRHGSLVIDTARREVTIHGAPLELTVREYELLAFLAAHPHRAFSRAALISTVWADDYDGGARTVDVHVRRVRSKLGPSMAAWLRTIRSVGYVFEPDG